MEKYKNINLNNALKARKDEFYTQYNDIEEEIKYYQEWFRGKTVLCNCGDSVESAFFQYFVTNFHQLGLSKLITVSHSKSLIVDQSAGHHRALTERLLRAYQPHPYVTPAVRSTQRNCLKLKVTP